MYICQGFCKFEAAFDDSFPLISFFAETKKESGNSRLGAFPDFGFISCKDHAKKLIKPNTNNARMIKGKTKVI